MGNKGKTFPPEPLDLDEVLALVGACSKTSSTGLRNRALIVVLWRSGLRTGEALGLFPKDVDLDEGVIRVLHGKGDKFRTVGVDEAAIAVLRLWIERRARLDLPRFCPLFCTLKGTRIDPSYLRHTLPRLAARAGIEKRVHAHGLRHTLTRDLVTAGAPMDLIRDQLGHTSLSTTDKYVHKVAPQRLVNFMRTRAWGSESEGGQDESGN